MMGICVFDGVATGELSKSCVAREDACVCDRSIGR